MRHVYVTSKEAADVPGERGMGEMASTERMHRMYDWERILPISRDDSWRTES